MVDLVPQYPLGEGPKAGEAFRTAEEQSRKYRLQREAEDRAAATARANEQIAAQNAAIAKEELALRRVQGDIARQQLAQRQQQAAQNAAIAREELAFKRMQEQRAALDSTARRKVALGTLEVARSAEARLEQARQDANKLELEKLRLQAERDKANIARTNATTKREKEQAARLAREVKRKEEANSKATQKTKENIERLYAAVAGLDVQPQQQPSATRPGSGVSDTDVGIPEGRIALTQPLGQQPQRPNTLMSEVLARTEAGLRAPSPQNYRSPVQPQQPADVSIQQIMPGTPPQLGAPVQPSPAPGGVQPQPPLGAQPRPTSIEDTFSNLNPDAKAYVERIRERLQPIGAVPELADKNTVTAKEYKASQRARAAKFDENLSLLQTFSSGFIPSSLRAALRRAPMFGASMAPSDPTPAYLEARYTTAEVEQMLGFEKRAQAAQKWYRTAKARKIFEANSELFQLAKLNPASFYEQYKDVKPKDISAVAAPAGVSLQGAVPTSQATPADLLVFGEITPEAITRIINPENPNAQIAEAIQKTYSAPVRRVQPVDRTALIGNDNRANYEMEQVTRAARAHYDAVMTEVARQNEAKIYDPSLYAKHVIKLEELKNQHTALRYNRDIIRFQLSNGRDYLGLEKIMSEKAGARVELRLDVETKLFDVWYKGRLTKSGVEPNALLTKVKSDVDSAFRNRQLELADKEAEHQRKIELDKKKGEMELEKAGLTAEAKLFEKEGFTFYRTSQDNTFLFKKTRVVDGRIVEELRALVKTKDRMGNERWVVQMHETTEPGRSTGGVWMDGKR